MTQIPQIGFSIGEATDCASSGWKSVSSVKSVDSLDVFAV